MRKEEENSAEKKEELPELDKKDIIALILAMYRVLLPQFLFIALIFFLVAFILLNFWFR
jgi:hypothetical protein